MFYFSDPGRPFSGGDLLLYDAAQDHRHSSGTSYTRICPANNMLLFFASKAFHQVTPVRFEQDKNPVRYTVNGWIHTAAGMPNS